MGADWLPELPLRYASGLAAGGEKLSEDSAVEGGLREVEVVVVEMFFEWRPEGPALVECSRNRAGGGGLVTCGAWRRRVWREVSSVTASGGNA